MKTVTKTITVSRKTSTLWTPDAEYNKRFINSQIIIFRRMFHMWGFVSLNQIKEGFLIKDSFKQGAYLKECMFLHSRDDYDKFEPVVSQDKNDPTKFKITMQFVDYSKERK